MSFEDKVMLYFVFSTFILPLLLVLWDIGLFNVNSYRNILGKTLTPNELKRLEAEQRNLLHEFINLNGSTSLSKKQKDRLKRDKFKAFIKVSRKIGSRQLQPRKEMI